MPNPMYSPAATDLGLGGALSQQVQDETDEARKKRMREQQLAGMSPSVASLFGPLGRGFGG